jgi:hypothetical protein
MEQEQARHVRSSLYTAIDLAVHMGCALAVIDRSKMRITCDA